MYVHRNAKLGLAGRLELVRAIEHGLSLRRAAERFSISLATAHRWWHRWQDASSQERETLACLGDRTSRPRSCPRRLAAAEEDVIVEARQATGYGPDRLSALLHRGASTIWKVLRRRGLSPRPRPARPSYRRYEWTSAGALLHMDVKKLPRFLAPGHRVTGDRRRRSMGAGFDYLHCVIDDHSRLAYVELHAREDADTNAQTLERALRFFAELGLPPPRAVMTDNAFVYTRSARFRQLLARVRARHILIPDYTPRWNGKVERFIGTLLTEWAYVRGWSSSGERARALLSFLRFYNRRRPHGSLGGLPPISRVHNLCGDHS